MKVQGYFKAVCDIIGKDTDIVLVVNDNGNTLLLHQGDEVKLFAAHAKDRINTVAAELGFDSRLAIAEVIKDIVAIGNDILNENGEETI